LLVAKKYNYDYNEQFQKEKKQIRKRIIRKKNSLSFKIASIISIAIISSCMILVLLGYTSIAETKYNIVSLNKDIEILEKEIQQLNAQLDSITRSDVIEAKAINELNMQYPKYEQMVFIKSADGTEYSFSEVMDIKDNLIEKNNKENTLIEYIVISLEKLYSLLD